MILPKALVNGVTLTDSAATYYTVGASTRAIIKKATFVNDDSIAVTVTVNLVPHGDTATYENRIVKEHVLAPGETWACSALESHEIESGGFISMLASVASKLGVRISGYEVT